MSTIFKFRAKKKTTTSNWQLILKVNIYFIMNFFKIIFWQYLKINLMVLNDLKIWRKSNEWLKNYRSRNIIKLQASRKIVIARLKWCSESRSTEREVRLCARRRLECCLPGRGRNITNKYHIFKLSFCIFFHSHGNKPSF